MNLALSTDFTVSHRFGVVVFSFSLVSMYIFISVLISPMISWLFRSILLSLHMFEFLIVPPPQQLRSNYNALWPETITGMVSFFFFFFQFTEARFMAQDVMYSGEGSKCT